MADEDVETILREIRERVRSTRPPAAVHSFAGNGASESATASNESQEDSAAKSVALIESYLTTTARAWDRLPPIVSNRSGASARLELWVKRQLKRAMRWFTWEQVNFNAAVHLALRDTHLALRETRQGLIDHQRALENVDQEAGRRHAEIVEQSQIEREELRKETRAQRSALAQELRDRGEHLLNEQRVCFKQLSLEASEAAVLEDRGRRKTEAALVELTRRIEELEKKTKS